MSFFIKNKTVNGTKRAKYSQNKNTKKMKPQRKPKNFNEELSSSDEETLQKSNISDHISSEDDNETAQDKKIRLAKLYLQEIEREEKTRLEREEIDDSVVSKRLKEDYLKESGKLRLSLADTYSGFDVNNVRLLKSREQKNCVTCVCVSSDNKHLYAGSKDGTILKYSLETYNKVGSILFNKNSIESASGHYSSITCIAISYDNKYLVSSDKKSKNIYVWDPNSLENVKILSGHKDTILGLCFKRNSHTLYSCSKDKTSKIWSLDDMSYIETLFGHQDSITSVDALFRDRLVTCGGRDLRIFKIPEETQLIFNGHTGNIDNVKLINEENFVSSGDDGQISIWSILRKKPLVSVQNAHGLDAKNNLPNWITSICSLLNSDLIASGSCDGFVRFWKLENNFKSVKLLFKYPIEGYVNCLEFTADGKYIIVAVSKEYKLGRWNTVKSAKNCILVVPLLFKNK